MLELMNGRPADCTGRLDKEIRCYDLLDSLGIDYQRIDHDPAMTMEACAEADALMGGMICKNLLLCNRQCTQFYLLLLPSEVHFKTSILSKEIGSSRLSFADGSYMEQFLDITPGSLSILGLMHDRENRVQLLIHEALLQGEYIGVHPCINTSSLKLKITDLTEKIIPAMGHEPRVVTLKNPEA